MKAKLLKNRKVFPSGTALIVALLVMGVLMAISLALSVLVLRESIVTREFLDAGQSYYAAESASEIGLYGVKNGLPGWQPKDGVAQIRIDKDTKAVAELRVSNNCKAYPCFDDGYDTKTALLDPKAFYATLGLNESATIPLFVVGEKGQSTDITGFRVQFYSKFTRDHFKKSLKDSGTNLFDWDVLRWKIVGFNQAGTHTESISDFTAVSFTNGGKPTGAGNPSWFGSHPCDEFNSVEDLYGNIKCIPYSLPLEVEGQPKPCNVFQAREFYLYSGQDEKDRENSVEPCWPLSSFINEHKLNYLTLTNLINPSMFDKKDTDARLFYRVELFTDESGKKVTTPIAREYANITADGYSGKSKQSVNVKIKRDSFMPVFNFSLYSTYMDKEGKDTENNVKHGEEYWYGKPATEKVPG